MDRSEIIRSEFSRHEKNEEFSVRHFHSFCCYRQRTESDGTRFHFGIRTRMVDSCPTSVSRCKLVQVHTINMHLSLIGGKERFPETLAILKKIGGVRGASLFFGQTALRVYYELDCTNPVEIQMALLAGLKPTDK